MNLEKIQEMWAKDSVIVLFATKEIKTGTEQNYSSKDSVLLWERNSRDV